MFSLQRHFARLILSSDAATPLKQWATSWNKSQFHMFPSQEFKQSSLRMGGLTISFHGAPASLKRRHARWFALKTCVTLHSKSYIFVPQCFHWVMHVPGTFLTAGLSTPSAQSTLRDLESIWRDLELISNVFWLYLEILWMGALFALFYLWHTWNFTCKQYAGCATEDMSSRNLSNICSVKAVDWRHIQRPWLKANNSMKPMTTTVRICCFLPFYIVVHEFAWVFLENSLCKTSIWDLQDLVAKSCAKMAKPLGKISARDPCAGIQ